MRLIQNVSRHQVEQGLHMNAEVLIQISDPPSEAPTPAYSFRRTNQFYFDDIEEETGRHCEYGIDAEQAAAIASILRSALYNGHNVVVHCNRGISRSGAVAQAAAVLGFTPLNEPTDVNQRVAGMITAALR